MAKNRSKNKLAQDNCAKTEVKTQSARVPSEKGRNAFASVRFEVPAKHSAAWGRAVTLARDLAIGTYGGCALPEVLIQRAAEMAMEKTAVDDMALYRTAVSDCLHAVVFEYEHLFERVFKAAKQAFPTEYAAGSLNETLVDYELDEVVTAYEALLCATHPGLDLDTFTDIIWPATKLRLAAALNTTVSIDASRLEAWYGNHRPAATVPPV